MKVAVVGATGLVGSIMRQILAERNFPITELIPVASEKSKGKLIDFKGNSYKVVTLQEAVAMKPDLALFSAGGNVSKEWAPKFEAVGTTVIDNSSAWRMSPDHKLIVPEINADILTKEDKIIANPNCSTIQMVVALYPLHKKYGVKRVVVSTYQSITGTGKAAVDQMTGERNGQQNGRVYPHQIDLNFLPHCDIFLDNDYTKEEMKMVNESRKIMDAPGLRLTATAVRVPVKGGHSESINVEFIKDFTIEEVKSVLKNAPGVAIADDIKNNIYPMPLTAEGKDEVFIGRIRRDESNPNTLNMWVVSDNLRKGAATNAVQIAEYLLEKGLLKAKSDSESGMA